MPFGVPIGDCGGWRDVFHELGWCYQLSSPKGNAWPLMGERAVRFEDYAEPWIISLTPPYQTGIGLKMGHSPSPGEPRRTSLTRAGLPERQAVCVVFRRSRLSLLLHERMRMTSSEYSLLEFPYSELTAYRYNSKDRIMLCGRDAVFVLEFRPVVASTSKAFNGLLKWIGVAVAQCRDPGEHFLARSNADINRAERQSMAVR